MDGEEEGDGEECAMAPNCDAAAAALEGGAVGSADADGAEDWPSGGVAAGRSAMAGVRDG